MKNTNIEQQAKEAQSRGLANIFAKNCEALEIDLKVGSYLIMSHAAMAIINSANEQGYTSEKAIEFWNKFCDASYKRGKYLSNEFSE